ncbi:MAG: glycosyltransferase family 4 protein [Planctomycetota bacterium]|jgi:glycosyltransferase involved in cell wall biosynthesis|nr:glycosyltransferase family 4 protein [Planctomycetota bacterium]
MRILFVYPVFPWPLDSGSRVRVYNLVKQLVRQGHEVGLVCFHEGSDDPGDDSREFRALLSDLRIVPIGVPHGAWWKAKRLVRILPLLAHGVPPIAAFARHPGIGDAIEELAGDYDAVLIGFYFMGFNVTDSLMAKAGRKFSLVEDDLSFVPLARKAAVSRWPEKALRLCQAEGGKTAEIAMIRRFPRVFVMSELDAATARELAPGTRVMLSPNGVDCAAIAFRPRPMKPEGPLSLVFVGGLAHYPNLDALRHFMGAVWPGVRKRFPGAAFTVVGSTGGVDVSALAPEGVRFAGFVPNVLGLYAGAHATVTPYRIGGGTRLKILEAMAAGLPVVSSAVGVEGLPATTERNFLLAETGDDIETALDRLMNEEGLARRLSKNGRRLVEERFDWPILARRLADDLRRNED